MNISERKPIKLKNFREEFISWNSFLWNDVIKKLNNIYKYYIKRFYEKVKICKMQKKRISNTRKALQKEIGGIRCKTKKIYI